MKWKYATRLYPRFYVWRIFLEEVDLVGGGVFFGESVFLLDEVMCVFGAGWH